MSIVLPLYERIKAFAKENGKSLSQIEKEAHFPKGTIKNTKNHTASIETVERIADCLGVSIDTLVGRASGDYLAEDERQLLALFRSMNAEGRAFLMQSAEMASARFFKTARDMGKNA